MRKKGKGEKERWVKKERWKDGRMKRRNCGKGNERMEIRKRKDEKERLEKETLERKW